MDTIIVSAVWPTDKFDNMHIVLASMLGAGSLPIAQETDLRNLDELEELEDYDYYDGHYDLWDM